VRDDKPAVHDHVVRAAWPRKLFDEYPIFESAETDANGAFTIRNLASGKYHAVSVGPAEWLRKDEPNVIADSLSTAGDITIVEKETRTIGLSETLP
jgi:hypothetical protein